jgi:hypothetical protein
MVNRLHASAATAICQPVLALKAFACACLSLLISLFASLDGGNNQNDVG